MQRPAVDPSRLVLATLVLLLFATGSVGATVTEIDASQQGPEPNPSVVVNDSTNSQFEPQTNGALRQLIELQRLQATPGKITVRVEYTIPSGVASLSTHLPAGAERPDAVGFNHKQDTEYRWDGATDKPQITFQWAVNETIDTTGPIAGRGEYAFVDVGDWALVKTPRIGTSWTRTQSGPTTVSRTVTTAGPGAASNAIAFLGAHSEVQRSANNQIFRLIIPQEANLAESPSQILDSVSAASDRLRVGNRDSEVFMVAAPTSRVRWGVRGLQTGEADMWVRDRERLDTADNVWIHEYVHTRQAYTARPGVRWFTEASAAYYAALYALEQHRIGFTAFNDRLALGATGESKTAILSNPETWNVIAPYLKGALVAGELDRQVRLGTDKQRSLQGIFGAMNSHPDPVTEATYRSFVQHTGGEAIRDLSDQYTTTSASPAMWDESAHGAAFDRVPALLSYHLPAPGDGDGYRVSGPYRSGSIRDGPPLRLVSGERLSVDVRIENSGGTRGTFDIGLLVDDQLVDSKQGEVEPGGSMFVTFSHQFTEPGEYTIEVQGNRRTVSVQEPVAPTVTGLSISPSDPEIGSELDIEATVQNDDDIPADGSIDLLLNERTLATESIRLKPHESGTISFSYSVDRPGDLVFRVGDHTVSMRIATPTPTPTVSPTPTRTMRPSPVPTTTETPGFGWVTAGLAIALALGITRRIR